MIKNNKSRDPLLYIQQPEWEFPKADMQQTYLVTKPRLKKQDTVSKPEMETKSETENKTENQTQSQNQAEPDDIGNLLGVTPIDQEKNNSGIRDHVERELEEKENLEVGLTEQAAVEAEVLGKERELEKHELDTAAVQEVIAQYNKERQEKDKASSFTASKKHSYSFKRVKSFKEMTIVEKVNYLVHFPNFYHLFLVFLSQMTVRLGAFY